MGNCFLLYIKNVQRRVLSVYENERCLQETWTSVELKSAVELEYVIKEIYDYKQKGQIF